MKAWHAPRWKNYIRCGKWHVDTCSWRSWFVSLFLLGSVGWVISWLDMLQNFLFRARFVAPSSCFFLAAIHAFCFNFFLPLVFRKRVCTFSPITHFDTRELRKFPHVFGSFCWKSELDCYSRENREQRIRECDVCSNIFSHQNMKASVALVSDLRWGYFRGCYSWYIESRFIVVCWFHFIPLPAMRGPPFRFSVRWKNI